MAIDKIFDGAVDGIADNLFNSVSNSVSEIKAMQQRKAAENVQLVVQALKKIDADIREKYDGVTETFDKRIASIKDGRDGKDGKNGLDGVNGKDGRDGKDGRNGRDGLTGPRGFDGPKGLDGKDGQDGEDGVSVTDAHIDFDGSLIISLSSGRVINVGEVVAADIAEKIKVITNGGGTSQGVLDAIASLQAQIDSIASGLEYQGTWNASTNVPTLASSVGTAGYYYIVATAGSTNLNGVTDWQVGDWAVFNGTVWQKIDQTNLVTSVAGRTGAIVLTTTDIGGLGTIATQAASNVSITGGSITGITDLAIADGGTGQSTAAAAITALTGTQTTGYYLRSNGTNAVLSAIIAGDVPTLNQSTTGSAGSLSTTLVTSSGGTGLTSFTNKGVLYASSTSTLATGTALQFDGTNFAVGTTPSAFGSTFRAVEVGDLASLAFQSSGVTKKTYLSTNSYNATNTGARPYYKANGLATEYSQNVGEHAWYTAPTGIAGSSTTITTGKIYTNLTVGNQTDFGASSNAIGTIWTATSSGTLSSGTVVQNIDFVESMRIDASSNVGIGISTPGSKLDVKGTLRLSGSTSGYVGLAPASAAGSTTYTLPSADGTNGQSLTTNGSGTLSWASGTGGTVTSVAMTVPSFLSVSGSPITSSGTLAVSLSGTALPIANGGTGQTTANAALNALLPAQTGNASKYLQTDGTNSSWDAISLSTADITGTLPTTNGGTGLTSFTANGVVYASSTSALTTSSALIFDGSNIGLGVALSSWGTPYKVIQLGDSTSSGAIYQSISGGTLSISSNEYISATGARYINTAPANRFRVGNGVHQWFTAASGTAGTSISYTQAMILDASGNLFINSLTASKAVFTDASKNLTSTGTLGIDQGGTGTTTPALVAGTNITITGSWPNQTINSSNTGGTVTSVSGTGTVSGLTLTGTVTSSGSLTLGGALDLSAYSGAGAFTTLSASSTVTLSGGTANGVAYLNGSKVVTSGSALTFDGTNIALKVSNGTQGFVLGVGGEAMIASDASTYYYGSGWGGAPAVNFQFGSTGTTYQRWLAGGSEQMRLTSTGLGIGTSSPAYKLDVTGNGLVSSFGSTSTAETYIQVKNGTSTLYLGGTSTYNYVYGTASVPLTFWTNSSEKMRLDSSGNLGLGVTPSAWTSTYLALQIGNVGSALVAYKTLPIIRVDSNSYIPSSGVSTYALTGYAATSYTQYNGQHSWSNAPSGTAGNAITFTQAMTLDASGRLGVGITSPTIAGGNGIHIGNASGESRLHMTDNTTGATSADGTELVVLGGDFYIDQKEAKPIIFLTNGSERARIDSSGNLLVGTTTASLGPTSGFNVIIGGGVTGTSIGHITGSSSGSYYELFAYNGSAIGSITQSGTTAVLYNTTSDQRLKENIQDADSASSLIDSLQVRKFDWKSDNTHQRYGFVAQELVTVAPEAVHQPEDTEAMMAVDYSKLVPMLVKEIQSLRKRLADAGI